jgi:hypothetical protein
MVLGGGWSLKKGGGKVLRYQGGAVVPTLVRTKIIKSDLSQGAGNHIKKGTKITIVSYVYIMSLSHLEQILE